MIKFNDFIEEKHLTPAELKKREEIAKAIEKDQPGIDMGKKMAIATAAAKRVAESEELDESAGWMTPEQKKDIEHHSELFKQAAISKNDAERERLRKVISDKREKYRQDALKRGEGKSGPADWYNQSSGGKRNLGDSVEHEDADTIDEELDESVIRIQHKDSNGNTHVLSSSSQGFVALNKGTSSLANVMHSAPGHASSGTKEKSDALNKAIKAAHAGGKESVLAAAKKATGLNWTHHSVTESEELDEAAVSSNKGRGFHGEHPEDVADKKFSAMHTQLKKKFGEEGHLRDVKKPNVMIKHFLDSVHGRHVAHEGDAEVSSRFKKFKKTYNPDLHESEELDEGSVSKEKQKTPYRNINSPQYKASAEKQHQQMARDKAAEPGKHLLNKIAKKVQKEDVDLEEGKHEGTIAAMAKSRYTPEPGHKIITKKGGQVPGTVEKLEKDYVYFRHPEGKLFRTHKDNVQLDRSVKESEELDEVKAAEDMAGTSATCSKQKSSDLGKSGKKAPGNKNINLAEAMSAEEGPGKGADFKEMSQEQHLECMKYHKDEYNSIKGKTHKYIKELDETGKTESKLKYHAKMYHKHKEAV